MDSTEDLSKSIDHEVMNTSDIHCQYLGLENDPGTIFNFPSLGNVCYHCKPPAVPLLEHQHKICLTNSFSDCPVFISQNEIRLPKSLSETINYKKKNQTLPWIIGGALTIVVIGLVILLGQNNPVITPEVEDSLSSNPTQRTLTSDLNQDHTPQPEASEPFIMAEVTPNITADVTQLLNSEVLLKLDTPIGSEQKFIIHSVLNGESIEQYAVQYDTNKQSIIDVNYFLPIPLWINWLIIIPIDLEDANDMPTFEAYVVTDNVITVEELALKLSIDATELIYYNGIESNYVLKSGNWLLIPREGYFFYN